MTQQFPSQSIADHERAVARLLVWYIVAGLVFLILPGTSLGVWNLVRIAFSESPSGASTAAIQAHGHAQLFGWIGTFILGIGLHSVPRASGSRLNLRLAWTIWVLWIGGLSLRWIIGLTGWQWRVLLPGSAVLELAAVALFVRVVSKHDASKKLKVEPWMILVIVGTLGFLAAMALNTAAQFVVAFTAASRETPVGFTNDMIVLSTWGFLVFTVWGFSARWLPTFLGLKPLRARALLTAAGVNLAGVITAIAGAPKIAFPILLLSALIAISALRLFERPDRAPKTLGVTPSFPFFVRMAYLWLLISASIGIAAALTNGASGFSGAARHAMAVGFLSMMVLAIGQRVLPAFSGMKLLWSTKLMFASLALIAIGCPMRVSLEIISYQGYGNWAWGWLPVSALLEFSGMILFAVNLLLTFDTDRESSLKKETP